MPRGRPKGSKNSKPTDQVSEVASVKHTSPDDFAKMQAENAALRAQLAQSEQARSEGEKVALEVAQAQGMLLQKSIEEVPTGKSVTVKRLDHYKVVGHKQDTGEDILRPIFKEVKLPTFYYKIDLPPCGGIHMRINGKEFYHGTVYEFDIDTLCSVKEIVYRCWDHDAQIHRSDDSFYRPKGTQRAMSQALR